MLEAMRATTLAVGLGSLVLAGCSTSGTNSNGEAGKPAVRVLLDTRAAAAAQHSVRVVGKGGPAGAVALDLELVAGQGGSGTVSNGALRITFVGVGGRIYVNASAAVWLVVGGRSAKAAQRLGGRWVEMPTGGGPLASLALYTQMKTWLALLLLDHGTVEKEAMINRDGARVLALADPALKSTLYIAASGAPLPVELREQTSAGTDDYRFENWNGVAAPKAPPGAVGYASVTG